MTRECSDTKVWMTLWLLLIADELFTKICWIKYSLHNMQSHASLHTGHAVLQSQFYLDDMIDAFIQFLCHRR